MLFREIEDFGAITQDWTASVERVIAEAAVLGSPYPEHPEVPESPVQEQEEPVSRFWADMTEDSSTRSADSTISASDEVVSYEWAQSRSVKFCDNLKKGKCNHRFCKRVHTHQQQVVVCCYKHATLRWRNDCDEAGEGKYQCKSDVLCSSAPHRVLWANKDSLMRSLMEEGVRLMVQHGVG